MNKIKGLIIGTAALLIISAVLITAVSLIFSKLYLLPEGQWLSMTVTVILAATVFLSALICCRYIKERGLIYGAMIGVIAILILLLNQVFSKSFAPEAGMIFKFLALIISGGAGGIIAANKKDKIDF